MRNDDPAQTIQAITDPDPLSRYACLVGKQREIAGNLEAIADSLPNDVDRRWCARLAEDMLPVLKTCWVVEDRVIFPRMISWSRAKGAHVEAVVSWLRDERLVDEGYVFEVCDLLTTLADTSEVREANAAGYLLRSVFEPMRRRARLELAYIVPRARQILEPDDLRHIDDLLKERRLSLFAASAKRSGIMSGDRVR